MIKEAIEKLVSLGTTQRPPQLEAKDGSKRLFIYDDKEARYTPLDRVVIRTIEVSNVESFAALVIEEARRRGRSDGDQMTVAFRPEGGYFKPDETQDLETFRYVRALSQQWQILEACPSAMEHRHFVRWIQALRPSFQGQSPQKTTSDFGAILSAYRRIHIGEKVSVTSQPTLIQGKAEDAVRIEFEMSGGKKGEDQVPAEFYLQVRYARGSGPWHNMTVEVDVSLAGEEGKKRLVFSPCVPDLEAVKNEAIEAEATWFRDEVDKAGLSNLLILEDF